MTKLTVLHSNNAPKAVGPYAQGVVPSSPGVPVLLSGQVGIDPNTNKLQESLEAQTRQVFQNISAVLAETNLGLQDILFCTVLLEDMSMFQEMNAIYEEVFGNHKPARAAYAAKGLPLGAKVEIVVTAWKSI